ncbi:hypothetical protein BJX99DRAFT_252732 [Aspergillus californicus]
MAETWSTLALMGLLTGLARRTEIKTTNSDGDAVSFFLKVTQGDIGKGMVLGEFHSMTALYSVLSGFAPKPIAWGTYKDDLETHFFLCHFHAMTGGLPKPISGFTEMVA